MSFELTPHPETLTGAVLGVQMHVHRGRPERLTLNCSLIGDVSRIRIPKAAGSSRADELWRHTCFELFVRAHSGGYYEIHFSPSQEWAAYHFDGYRLGITSVAPRSIIGLGVRVETGGFGGYAELDLSGLSDLDMDAPFRVGASAVVEEMDGYKSYWALAHPPGKPDFHHPVAFAGEVSKVVYW
jgi:hypothetical protein